MAYSPEYSSYIQNLKDINGSQPCPYLLKCLRQTTANEENGICQEQANQYVETLVNLIQTCPPEQIVTALSDFIKIQNSDDRLLAIRNFLKNILHPPEDSQFENLFILTVTCIDQLDENFRLIRYLASIQGISN